MNYHTLDRLYTHLSQYGNTKTGKGLTHSSIKKIFAALRKVYYLAVSEDLVLKNPITDYEYPRQKIKNPEPEVFTLDELITLLNYTFNRYSISFFCAVYLTACLGLRRSELAGIRFSDIDLDNNIIYIRNVRVRQNKEYFKEHPKSSSSVRSFKINDKILMHVIRYMYEALDDFLEKDPKKLKEIKSNDPFLFTNLETLKPYGLDYFTKTFKKLIKTTNINPNLKFHSLRHTSCSLLVNELDISLSDASKFMGHSDIEITKHYTHSLDKNRNKATELLSGFVGSKVEELFQ